MIDARDIGCRRRNLAAIWSVQGPLLIRCRLRRWRDRVTDRVLSLGQCGVGMREHSANEGNKLGGERQLAVARLPSGSEGEEFSLADVLLEDERVAVVEPRDRANRIGITRLHPAVVPEVYLREIGEARVVE